jgi:hypothetical protein
MSWDDDADGAVCAVTVVPTRYRFLAPVVAAGLLVAMAVQLVAGLHADSATSDEPIHLLSGYALLTQHHLLFDPDHPPLFKALAALPLLLVPPALPYGATHLTPAQAATTYDTYAEANAWGYRMLFGPGNDGRLVLTLGRLVAVAVTLALAAVLWRWTAARFGTAGGLLALALVAFDPSFLAHGHLANDDTAAALALVLALGAFDRFLRGPTPRALILAALTFGLALLTKYSLLLLVPIDLLLLVLWLGYTRGAPPEPAIFRRLPRPWQRYAAGLLVVFVVGWLTVWVCYGALMLINPAQNPVFLTLRQRPAHAAAVDVLLHIVPAQYAKGLGGIRHPRLGYLLGTCFVGSRFAYFPVLALFKVPLPTLLLVALGVVLLVRDRRRVGFVPAVLLVPGLVFLPAAGVAGIDIGFRHALPFYAPVLVAAAYPATCLGRLAGTRRLAAVAALTGLLLWLAVGTLGAAPNFLPYYNALAGEPQPVPYVATDSNVDWGQATKALAAYLQAHRIRRVAFANFFGFAEADAIGLAYVPADPRDRDYHGYLALSRSAIVADRCGGGDVWGWLVDTQTPIAVIAGAINLYRI